MKNSMGKYAFTLAETLITLVIIGVIAAICMQVLFVNAKKQEVLSKLKKTYSTVSRAIRLSQIDNGCYVDEWYSDTNKNATDYYNTYYKPYFQISRRCTDYSDCGYDSYTPWKYAKNTTYNWYISDDEKTRFFFYLLDGQFIAVQTGSYPDNKVSYMSEPDIIVDINGSKKPNIIGRDVFFMVVTEEGIKPYGYNAGTSTINSNCSKSGSGLYCLQRIMMNSWEMDEGYPF